MSTLSAFYSDPIDINILKGSFFIRNNPSIQIISINDKRVTIDASSKYVFLYSDAHICVLVRSDIINNGRSVWELYDSYPFADTRISQFIDKSVQLANAATSTEIGARTQRDENSCIAYCTVYVHLRESAGLAHKEATSRLGTLPLITVRETAFRILNVLE